MVRIFGVMLPREIDQCHKGLMGGMTDADRERILRHAEERGKLDYWPTQQEMERDAASLTFNRLNANNYVPDHAARCDRYMLRKAIKLSLGEDPVQMVA